MTRVRWLASSLSMRNVYACQLAALDTATSIEDMAIPGFKLHSLKGTDKDRWSVWVNGNWRVTFEFREGNAFVLDYEGYH